MPCFQCTDWFFDEQLLKLEQISISLFTRKAWKIHNLAWLGRWISTFELQMSWLITNKRGQPFHYHKKTLPYLSSPSTKHSKFSIGKIETTRDFFNRRYQPIAPLPTDRTWTGGHVWHDVIVVKEFSPFSHESKRGRREEEKKNHKFNQYSIYIHDWR